MAAFSGSFDFRPLPSPTTKSEVGLGFRPVIGRGGRRKKRVGVFGVWGFVSGRTSWFGWAGTGLVLRFGVGLGSGLILGDWVLGLF